MFLAAKVPLQPQPPSIAYRNQLVAPWWFLVDGRTISWRWQRVWHILLVAYHNNKILPNYTRVKVHTMKPEFIQWKIDYTNP
jgi:hypothetical protein